jgi:DNA repair protein RecO
LSTARAAARSIGDLALVLRRFAYGESSLVVHVLTRANGKAHLLAKGAYRPRSRYGGVLDLFDTLEVRWSERAGAELGVLENAQLLERRHRIAHSLDAYRAALTVLELASLAAPERAACAELFDRCTASLDALRAGRDPTRCVVEFELGFLHNLGLAPTLEACASCGGAAPATDVSDPARPRAEFSASAGGRLCAACARRARESGVRVGTLPLDVLDLAAALRRWGPLPALPAPELLERAHDLTARFVQHQLESQPKSYRVFLAGPHRNRKAPSSAPTPREGDAW